MNLKSFNHINKISLKQIKNNNYNLFTFKKNIINISDSINNSNCIYIKGMANHLIYVLGDKYLKEEVTRSIKSFIIEDVDKYIDLTSRDEFYKIKISDNCDNNNSIKLKKFHIIQ